MVSQVSMEVAKKTPAILILSRVGQTCRKYDKSSSIWQRSFLCVMYTCSIFSSVTEPLLQYFNRIKFIYYILRVSHDKTITHTSDLTAMASLFLFNTCVMSYLLQLLCHPLCTVYISSNISASQSTCTVWLTIGIYHMTTFCFLLFSYSKKFHPKWL